MKKMTLGASCFGAVFLTGWVCAAGASEGKLHRYVNLTVRNSFGARQGTYVASDNGASSSNVQASSQASGPTLKELRELFSSQTASFGGALLSNKFATLTGAALVGALFVYYKLRLAKEALDDAGNWSLWRAGESLASLFKKPEKTLISELLGSVHEKYAACCSLSNLSEPLQRFFADVKQEQSHLDTYKYWATRVQVLPVGWVIPVDTALMRQIDERKSRLAFFEDKVLTWFSRYQLGRQGLLATERNTPRVLDEMGMTVQE